MTDRLPNFQAYTGVRPAPSPVRREEPDWEEYTGVRKAKGAFGDPRYVEAGKPSERNFGEGPGYGSARAAAFGAWIQSNHGSAAGLADEPTHWHQEPGGPSLFTANSQSKWLPADAKGAEPITLKDFCDHFAQLKATPVVLTEDAVRSLCAAIEVKTGKELDEVAGALRLKRNGDPDERLRRWCQSRIVRLAPVPESGVRRLADGSAVSMSAFRYEPLPAAPEHFAIGDRVTHSEPGSFDLTITVDHVYESGSFTGVDDAGKRWTIATKELAGCRKVLPPYSLVDRKPDPECSGFRSNLQDVLAAIRARMDEDAEKALAALVAATIQRESPEELRALGFKWAGGVAPIMGGDFAADSAFIRDRNAVIDDLLAQSEEIGAGND